MKATQSVLAVLVGGGKTSVGTDFGLLLLRLWVGLTMSLVWGLGKLPPPDVFVTNVGRLGFPLPTVFAWAAVLSEVLGGALLVLGLMTRPAAFFLAFTMLVAVFQVKADVSFWDPDRLNPTHYLVACLVLLFTGSGRVGLDMALRPKERHPYSGR